MKLTKTICLAALAALAAMAFVGASTASATSTSLCGADSAGATCPSPLTHIHEVDPELLRLNDINGYIECIGLFLGTGVLGNGLENPLHILGNFSYSSCEDEAGRLCTYTELGGPALIEVLKIETELALLFPELELLARCGLFIHCVTNGTGLDITVEGALHSGGTGLSKTHNEVVNKVSGFGCPSLIELDSLYAPLSATYIRE